MFKFLVIFCLVFATAKAGLQNVGVNITAVGSGNVRNDYIQLNSEMYKKIIADFDERLKSYQQFYIGSIEALQMQVPLIVASVENMKRDLELMEVLDATSKKCVAQHRSLVPTVAATQAAFKTCSVQASNQLPNLLKNLQNTRNSMSNYIKSYFEQEIQKCGKSYAKPSADYTNCITTVTRTTNNNVIIYQKTFDNMLDEADCSCKANIKKAAECFTNVQNRTYSQITEAEVSIKFCLNGKTPTCPACPAGCSETMNWQVDYDSYVVKNPFFNAKGHKGCLLLKLK